MWAGPREPWNYASRPGEYDVSRPGGYVKGAKMEHLLLDLRDAEPALIAPIRS